MRWEYRRENSMYINPLSEDFLNRLGNNGWELVSVLFIQDTKLDLPAARIDYYFKRPLEE